MIYAKYSIFRIGDDGERKTWTHIITFKKNRFWGVNSVKRYQKEYERNNKVETILYKEV